MANISLLHTASLDTRIGAENSSVPILVCQGLICTRNGVVCRVLTLLVRIQLRYSNSDVNQFSASILAHKATRNAVCVIGIYDKIDSI